MGKKTMKIQTKAFRLDQGDYINLKKWPTAVDPVYKLNARYRASPNSASRN
jgi:hypothetical protein